MAKLKCWKKKGEGIWDNKKMRKVCIGESYQEKYPHGVHIVKKKPKHFALKRRTNKYFTEYSIGTEGYFVPKKGVKLRKC